MAAASKNYFDVLEWMKKVIQSCKTIDQASSARRLLTLFRRKYRKDRQYKRSDYEELESLWSIAITML